MTPAAEPRSYAPAIAICALCHVGRVSAAILKATPLDQPLVCQPCINILAERESFNVATCSH